MLYTSKNNRKERNCVVNGQLIYTMKGFRYKDKFASAIFLIEHLAGEFVTTLPYICVPGPTFLIAISIRIRSQPNIKHSRVSVDHKY